MPKIFLNNYFRLYEGYIVLVQSSYCIKDLILVRSISYESIRVLATQHNDAAHFTTLPLQHFTTYLPLTSSPSPARS